MQPMDTAIIGGGAAGLFAAVQIAQAGTGPVAVLEKADRVGRKLLATGNGTCNITNRDLALRHYHGGHPTFARPALKAFPTGIPKPFSPPSGWNAWPSRTAGSIPAAARRAACWTACGWPQRKRASGFTPAVP